MKYELPPLGYPTNALEPVISQQTVELHYGKHFQAYVDNLNKLVPGTEFEGLTVEEIVAKAPDGPIFNNAGQTLNHTYYFAQFAKEPQADKPQGKLAAAIDRDFGSFEAFKEQFTEAANTLFGSGWAWLSCCKQGRLKITKEPNGGNPYRKGRHPLLGIDVWEHSYYLDYMNKRADHVKALWQIIDWKVVSDLYDKACCK